MQPALSNDQEVIGTREAARTLGVSVRTVQLWVEKGKLRAWKTAGGHRRILRASVEEALREREHEMLPENTVSSPSVLIVEDDSVMQTYYGALFEILNAEADLFFAADGFEGLVELGKISPDLMLVDIDMPNMDGITMLNRIESGNLAENTRVVVVTALSGTEVLERGGVPTDIPVYSKPLSVDDLEALLREHE
jgi:excisionase family DNA binding protein